MNLIESLRWFKTKGYEIYALCNTNIKNIKDFDIEDIKKYYCIVLSVYCIDGYLRDKYLEFYPEKEIIELNKDEVDNKYIEYYKQFEKTFKPFNDGNIIDKYNAICIIFDTLKCLEL